MGTKQKQTCSGVFSVSKHNKVLFASGNLQYRASDNSWQFAEHQYDIIGNGIGNTTDVRKRSTQSDSIDLFGYGATGIGEMPHTAHPYTTATNAYRYFSDNTHGTPNDLSYPYNASHDGRLFRTLTSDEWEYVLFGRDGERFAKAVIHGVPGILLIPNNRASGLKQVNNPMTSYTQNVIGEDFDRIFEFNGYVFLPCAGYRHSTRVVTEQDNPVGKYASSTSYNAGRSCVVCFGHDVGISNEPKCDGVSVRLVSSL